MNCYWSVDEVSELILSAANSLIPDEGPSCCLETRLENSGLDSLAFIHLLIMIEDELGIIFPDEYLIISRVGCISDLVNAATVELEIRS